MNKVVSEDALRRALLVANLLARERPLDSKQMRLDLAGPSVHEANATVTHTIFVIMFIDPPLCVDESSVLKFSSEVQSTKAA